MPDAERVVHRMASRLQHRGPNDCGVWLDQAAGIALGHRRLSIVDLSPAGHQPMVSGSGRYTMVFNGEIYNHQRLRQQLGTHGRGSIAWRGYSDTETVLACLDRWGPEQTLQRCSGMFALAVWDARRQSLLLARDRLGEKPLYYGWQGDTFLFGSELKALQAHPRFVGAIDRSALTLLLRHNFIPTPYSIYEGISKLPAGTWLEVVPNGDYAQPVPYWELGKEVEPGPENMFGGTDEEAVDQLQELLGGVVQGQMMADVPLGALLSGGVDSSLVCALMQSGSSRPIKTFTIGFGEQQYNEAPYAKAVARHLGTDHTELYLSASDAIAVVPSLPEIWDEPFADSSQLPTALVMKLAGERVSVALSGDGGDEVFCGYNRYQHVPRLVNTLGRWPAPLRRLAGRALTAVPAAPINKLLGAALSQPGDKAHKLGQRLQRVDFSSIDEVYLSLLTEWPAAESPVIGGNEPVSLLGNTAGWPNLQSPVGRMMALDSMIYLPDDILVKVDRAAMAASLETRAPFLDHKLVEFAWRLPLHFKQRNGQGKWVLRQLLNRYVPGSLIDRPKMGFGVPLDEWLRGPLRDWAETLLAGDRLEREGFFLAAPVRSVWQAHSRGKGNYGYRLWSVLMFQAWLEQHTQ